MSARVLFSWETWVLMCLHGSKALSDMPATAALHVWQHNNWFIVGYGRNTRTWNVYIYSKLKHLTFVPSFTGFLKYFQERISCRIFHSSVHNFLYPCSPWSSLLPSVYCPIHLSLLQFQLSQSAASPSVIIYVNTVQYQIILLHGCVKWLGHQFGSSSLLTIFGCVSNPFSAQPWSCGSSAWRHCVSVDPYGAEHREGGTHSPLSTSYTYFTRLGL